MSTNKTFNKVQLDVKFTQATTRANLISEENISISFGKISKYFADLHSQAFTGYTHPTYTARTGKPTGNQTPGFGSTFTISQITSDGTGHVTAATDRTVKIPDTTMGAASADAAGTKGLVPAPAAGKQTSFLRGDGTWVVPTNTDTLVSQTFATASYKRPLLMSYYKVGEAAGTAQVAYRNDSLYCNPSNGRIFATGFYTCGWDTSPAATSASLQANGLVLRAIKTYGDGHTLDYNRYVVRTYSGKTGLNTSDWSSNGMLVTVEGGGLTIVGGGESAASLAGLISDDYLPASGTPNSLDVNGDTTTGTGYYHTSLSGSSENLILSADTEIYFVTNANTIANRKAARLTSDLYFAPLSTNTGSIGTSTYQWNTVFGKTIYENGTSLASKYAAIGHKHTTTIAANSGTNQLTLSASTKYKLTAGETNFIFTTPPNTTYSAGTGLSLSGTTFNHSNSVTAVTNYNKPYVKYDTQGHITGSSYWTATAAGTSDESGWIKVATMVHTDTHDDTPIMLLVSQRGNTITYKLHIVWKNTSNTDPDIDKFRLSSDIDTNADAYIKKSTTSTWELYIKKLDNWDAIAMHLYAGKYFPDHMTWTWQDVQTAESAITGGIEAEKIVPYNYYQSRTANTVLAAPNGSAGTATFRKLVAADIPALSYLPTAGGTMEGNISFKSISGNTYPIASNKIIWNGGTDGIDIYYNLRSDDAGELIMNMRDDTNVRISFAHNGTVKSYIDTNGNFSGNAANVTGTVAIANGGTGATTRLNALKNLTNENVGSSANYFLTITSSWGKGGYTSVADAKTVLGLKSAAYTESSDYVPNTQAGMNAAINLLSTGTSTPGLADYYVSQYVNGGTTATSYHRRPISSLWNAFKELITLTTTGSGNAVTDVSIANDGDHNRKITVTKGSTFIPMSGSMGVTGNIEITKASGDVGFYTKRSDTGVEVWMGVGSGGTNHGIYSNKLGKWMMYGDATDVYLNGNAATSSSWATARTLTLGGQLTGSVSVKGDANMTLSGHLNRAFIYDDNAVPSGHNWDEYAWHKFAEVTITDAWADCIITFLVSRTFGNSAENTGILSAKLRTNGSKAFDTAQLKWLVRNSGLSKDDFVMVYTSTSGTSTKAELWCRIPTQHSGLIFTVLKEHRRHYSTDVSWTLVKTPDATGSTHGSSSYPTTGITDKIISSDGTITNSTTGTATSANKLNTNAGATNRPVYFSGGVPVQCDTPASGSWFKGVPLISSDGVMEFGKYIDFHKSNDSTADYDLRLQYTGTATGKTITLPGASGNVALLAKSGTSYYGMLDGDGTTSGWIRTTTNGFLPVQSGDAGSGHSKLGASSWYFAAAYIDNIHGNTFGVGKASTIDGEMLFYNSGGSGVTTLKGKAQSTNGTYLLPARGNGSYTLSCGHEDLAAATGSLSAANVIVPSYTKFIKIVFKSDSNPILYSMVEIPYFGNGDYGALVQVGTYGDGQNGSPRIVMKAVIINITDGTQTGRKSFTVTVSPTTKINGSSISNFERNITIYKIYAMD